MNSLKENIYFVLIEPKEPGNIGASARALKNMGFINLEIVKPFVDIMSAEAKWMACNAIDILERAKVYLNFEEAINNKSLIIGTTRRFGKRRGLILPLTSCIKQILMTAQKNKIAILFGREDKGLNNKEIEKCGFLITIPTDPLAPSLNLAQAVMLIAYELNKKIYKISYPKLIEYKEIELLYKRINTLLKRLEYIPKGNRDLEKKIMKNIKHLFGRSGLTHWEFNMLHGICTQIEKKLDGL